MENSSWTYKKILQNLQKIIVNNKNNISYRIYNSIIIIRYEILLSKDNNILPHLQIYKIYKNLFTNIVNGVMLVL